MFRKELWKECGCIWRFVVGISGIGSCKRLMAATAWNEGYELWGRRCRVLFLAGKVFAGTGPLEDEIKNISNIKNVGFKQGQALETLIREAKFSIYPSEWYENCPFSVMESQMYGTPVIGSKIGGIPELIEDGKTGELFESGNAQALKSKIQKLWSDDDLTDHYTQNCKNIKFDNIEEYTQKLLKIYQGS